MTDVRKVIPIQPAVADDGDGLFSIYQAHRKIYPRAVTGLFARLRWAAVIFTQVIFYGLPWLSWNERQAVLFDLGARKFYLFGVVLWPQDFIYLAGLLVVAALSLFFFTAVAGRLWCGYACPQTVYTELFMWIERRVEGDRAARMKLDASPMSAAKLGRKATKHTLWLALALLTGFTFTSNTILTYTTTPRPPRRFYRLPLPLCMPSLPRIKTPRTMPSVSASGCIMADAPFSRKFCQKSRLNNKEITDAAILLCDVKDIRTPIPTNP